MNTTAPSPSARRTSPRFGVGHLLIWTSGICVYLAVVRAIAIQQPNQPFGLLGWLHAFFQAVLAGAAWTGLAVFALRLWRGESWGVEAGHWLLVVLGGSRLVEVALALGIQRAFRRTDLVVAAVTCCLLVLPTFSRSLSVAWKVVFTMLALLGSLRLTEHLLLGPGQAGAWLQIDSIWRPLCGAVLVAVVTVADVVSRRPASWLHGLGVTAWILAAVVAAFVAWR